MSTDPYPTRTRLRLLRDINTEPGVRQYRNGDNIRVAGWRRVNSAVQEQERAGWVELGDREHADEVGDAYRLWTLTDAGRAVLGGGAA